MSELLTVVAIETFFSIAELAEIVFEDLSPATLFRLARCSRKLYHAVLSYVDYAFDIDARLGLFFSNPTSFRTLQARTNTLISGSAALQFFDRSYYEGSDLDLYTPIEHHLEVGDWLIREGYTFRPGKWQPASFKQAALKIVDKVAPSRRTYRWKGIAGVFDFVRESKSGREDKVQVVVALRGQSPMEVVLGFHSSESM